MNDLRGWKSACIIGEYLLMCGRFTIYTNMYIKVGSDLTLSTQNYKSSAETSNDTVPSSASVRAKERALVVRRGISSI